MSTRGREEAGVATVWGVAVIGLLLVVAVVAVGLVGVVAGHRRAQAGADLAALAGADALRDGADACRTAARIAAANRGRLTSCVARGARVRVVVEVRIRAPFGGAYALRGRALAGPGEVSP